MSKLRAEASESFLYYPETDVARGNSKREIDAAVLLDGRLVLVEAKTNNTVTKKEVDYYCGLARRTRAKRLIFATASRRRQDCGSTACACKDESNRDHGWDDGSQVRIAEARQDLLPHGISVETWCYDDLVLKPPVQLLEPFTRRR